MVATGTLLHIDGFEIGGLELAQNTQLTPLILGSIATPNARSGAFSLQLSGGASQDQYETWGEWGSGGTFGATTFAHHLLHIGVKFADLSPGTEYAFVSILDDDGNVVGTLVLETGGNLRLDNQVGSTVLTVTTPFTVGVYSVIELAFRINATGEWELWVEGDSKGSGTSDFLNSTGDIVRGILLGGAGSGDGNVNFDDFALVGHTSTLQGNNLGPSEVFAYQHGPGNSDVDAGLTTNDDPISIRSTAGGWNLISDSPLNSSEWAGWGGSPEDGAAIFDEDRFTTNDGHKGGPVEGSLTDWAGYDVTGTIQGAMWLGVYQRGTGGGSSHVQWYGEGSQSPISSYTMDTIANSADTFRAIVSDDAGPVPTSSQSFAMGAGTTGAQNIEIREQWAFLLHTPSLAGDNFFETVLGDMPFSTGIINRGKEILGNLPSQVGVIFKRAITKFAVGNMPFSTGVVLRGKEILGNMPTSTGVIRRGIDIVGDLPNQVGVIFKRATTKFALGNVPFSTGEVTTKLSALRTILGNMPFQVGIVIRATTKTVLGNMPFSVGDLRSPLSQYILDVLDNVVSYWPMGEPSGDVIDHSGNENDGTVTLGSGVRDAAALDHVGDGSIDFDGADTKVLVDGIAADLSFNDIFDGGGSVFFMFDADSDGESSLGIILINQVDSTLNVSSESGGFVKLSFKRQFDSGANPGHWRSTNADIPINTTIIGVVTYNADSVSNDPTIYLWDGTTLKTLTVGDGLDEVSTPAGTRDSDIFTNLIIGSSEGSLAVFDGQIDEIALFTDILTLDEARNLINAALKKGLFFEIILGVIPFATGVVLRGKTLVGNMPSQAGALIVKAGKIFVGAMTLGTGVVLRGKEILGDMPSQSGTLARATAKIIAGNMPNPTGVVLRGIEILGNLPAQVGVVLRKFGKLILGDMPFATGEFTRTLLTAFRTFVGNMPNPTGVVIRGKTLLGNMPFSIGALTTVLNGGVTLLGNMPAQVGILTTALGIKLFGNMPAQAGAIIRATTKTIVGDMPNATGIVIRKTAKVILGNMPNPTGIVLRGITILGNLPQQTATVFKGFVEVLVGNMPLSTGVIVRKTGKILVGVMPFSTGVVLRGITIVGEMPAFAGTFIRGKLTAARVILGNMPQQTGVLIGLAAGAAGNYLMKLRRKRTGD